MSQTLGIVLIMIAALLAAVVVVLGSARIKASNKRAELDRHIAADAEQIAALAEENRALRARLGDQGERLAVLERIATDPGQRTAREIEMLR